uniref:Uncharacterized protein n=1 Tax=viral metagenome TaxID=1070528 RepID=A0A6C0E4H1_9ZZZZ
MFTKLYLETTNPKLSFYQLFDANIFFVMIFSIVLHTIIYSLFVNMVSWIFFGKILSKQINKRLLLALILIMFFGFISRFIRVKEIYKAYNGNMEKTRNHTDHSYISWIFIS